MVSRTTRKRIHQQIRIGTSITILLCRKERSRETTPMPRLQISERIYETKFVPLTTNIRSYDKAKRIKILYQTGYTMGIQQRSNKRRRPMESSLCNQSRMDDYFRDLTDKGWLVIYMDDILIHARTKEELENRTKQVLERLKNNDLYLKPEKCKFAQREVEFLGMIVTENTIKMDPIKLAGIRDWPTPTTVKQVRSFLGFRNYYRKFISGFAHLARPLHELTKKNKIWTWTVECQVAFDLLKERFTSAPVLRMPDVNLPFILQTDASDHAIGAVLMQADENGDLHPCGYLSHTLTPTETRWQIYDRELYAIYYALFKEWRYLLEGADHPVTIQCDHKNLLYY